MAIDDILSFTAGFDADSFAASRLVQHAVERQLITLGEALGAFRKADPELARRLVDLPQIVATRHHLVHAYDLVPVQLVWEIAKDLLRPLRVRLVELLSEIDRSTA